MTPQDPMLAPYYSTDLDIPIVQIFAKNKKHAEAIINDITVTLLLDDEEIELGSFGEFPPVHAEISL